jgi:hypothetical protein
MGAHQQFAQQAVRVVAVDADQDAHRTAIHVLKTISSAARAASTRGSIQQVGERDLV